MAPEFLENDNVITSVLPYVLKKPKIGDVVVFEYKGKTYIKRIKVIDGENYYLIGDNKNDSYDSREFGYIKRENIKGKIILKF